MIITSKRPRNCGKFSINWVKTKKLILVNANFEILFNSTEKNSSHIKKLSQPKTLKILFV